MSTRQERRTLEALFEQGRVICASGDTPGRPNIRQTVSLRRTRDGTATVHVEHYYPTEWDHTIDEAERGFATFAEALEWLESHCGISWTQLHEPRPPG